MKLTFPKTDIEGYLQGLSQNAGEHATETTSQYSHSGIDAGFWAAGSFEKEVNFTEFEYFHVLSGTCEITNSKGASWIAEPGMSMVIPPGFTGTWKVTAPLLKIYVSYEPSKQLAVAPNPYEITILDAASGSAPTAMQDPKPATIISGSLKSATAKFFTLMDGSTNVVCGVRFVSPGRKELVGDSNFEFCRLIRGQAELTITGEGSGDDSGDPVILTEGDAFVIPAGAKGFWEVKEHAQVEVVVIKH